MKALKALALILVAAIGLHMISLFAVGTVVIGTVLIVAAISNPILAILEITTAILIGYLCALIINRTIPQSV